MSPLAYGIPVGITGKHVGNQLPSAESSAVPEPLKHFTETCGRDPSISQITRYVAWIIT